MTPFGLSLTASWLWNSKCLRYRLVCCVKEPLVHYTVHASSVTSDSNSRDWQRWGENIGTDLTAYLRDHGRIEDEKVLRRAARNLVGNVITSVWIQRIGQPGWVGYLCREVVRARKFTCTFHMLRRLIRDGWKLVGRVRGTSSRGGLRTSEVVSEKSREAH
jgi:hypothetical protein